MESDIKPESGLVEGTLFELHQENVKGELSYLVVAKDPGAANCLSPVVEGLLVKNRRLSFFAKDRAFEIFQRNFSSRSDISESSPESAVKEPTVVLAAGTSDPEYEGRIIQRIKQTNPKSKLVLIEDFPGSLIGLMQKLASLETPISPDLVFVTSRSSGENMDQRFPNFGKDKIIPVGQPAFDSLLLEETQTVNEEVRGGLQIQPTDLLVTYSGVPSQDRPGENSQALKLIVSALSSITNRSNIDIYFVNRNHPREVDPAQFIPILEAASQRVKIIDELQHRDVSIREITAASNLVVTTISTTGLETALRGSRPQTRLDQTGWLPVHIFLPRTQEYIKRTAGSLPVIELGATGVASKEEEVEPIIERSLFDRDFKQEILEAQQGPLRKEYRFYGKRTSTDRVLFWLRYFEKNG